MVIADIFIITKTASHKISINRRTDNCDIYIYEYYSAIRRNKLPKCAFTRMVIADLFIVTKKCKQLNICIYITEYYSAIRRNKICNNNGPKKKIYIYSERKQM